ncbi:methionine ABC transporter ATP-binding protein [Pseudogracilibacillus sp. ICA-222130]|uniref:methionine ABC transporter ATP-binding protein n=1 Tax=Pseudogracilibacillus sp. ICA-222130 TaxID=3134655 RepID=UPI0030C6184D
MIKLEDVTKVFKVKDKEIKALHNISLHINKGDIFGVIGLSGAGKSTLIRTINFLERPTSGKVIVEGEALHALKKQQLRQVRKNIGMIFQHFNLLQTKTIFQNVAIPLILEKQNKQAIRERVMELLSFVGLEDKANDYPSQLSGGQKQRVGIARALATNPSILLCDEATSALDPQTTDSVLDLLKKINETYNITIVMIAHDMNIIKKICHRVAVMEDGKIIETGDVIDVFKEPKHASTEKFVETVVHRNIPSSIYTLMEKKKDGVFIQIPFINDQTGTLVSTLSKEFQLDVDMVYASMDEIKDDQVGFMVLHLLGTENDIQNGLQYIKSNNMTYQEVGRNV